MKVRSALRRPRTWLIGVPVVVVLVGVVGPFVYINLIREDAPDRLELTDGGDTSSDTTGSSTTSPNRTDSIDGTWTVGDGSLAGYRVDEVLFGQDAEAVGRTSDVPGELAIDGTTISSAEFSVDLTTVQSDESRRDNQFQGRIMDTATYPTATFTLTSPIELDTVPEDLEQITVSATGDFTIHGVTKSVTFDVAAQRNGDTIELNGTIPVVFADYGIPEPSFGPASVEDHGEIEALLVLRPA